MVAHEMTLDSSDERYVAIAALQSRNLKVRERARRFLCEAEPSYVLPALIEALAGNDDFLKTDVADILGCLGALADSAVPAMVHVLRQRRWTFLDPFIEWEPTVLPMVDALAKIQVGVETEIATLFLSSDPGVRRRGVLAAKVLVEACSEGLGLLLEAVHDENRWVRAEAALALWQVKANCDATVAALKHCLDQDEEVIVRIRADYALRSAVAGYRAAFARAPAVLQRLLESDDLVTRARAAETLMLIGREALPAAETLVRRLRRHESMVTQEIQALNAFARLNNSVLEQVVKALQSTNDTTRVNALLVLYVGGCGAEQVLPSLLPLATREKLLAREMSMVLGILSQFVGENPECIAVLERIALRGSAGGYRADRGRLERWLPIQACMLLERVSTRDRARAKEILARAMRDPDADVRAAAEVAFRNLGGEEAAR